MSLHAELRTLSSALLELIRQEEGPLLTTAEEFAFFRGLPPKIAPVAPPPPVPYLEPPPPQAPPAPVVQAEPPPKVERQIPVEAPPKRIEVRPSLEMRAVLKKVAPELTLVEQPPDDAFAQAVTNRWKTRNLVAPITLLTYKDTERPLLEAIAAALDVLRGPARLLEAEAVQWETLLGTEGLKWVIMTDAAFYQLPELRAFYRPSPQMLGRIPLFLLPDLSLYAKDPLLKKSLWKALQQAFP